MESNAQNLFVIHVIQIIVISNKLKKKKLNTLIRKYEDAMCHAQKEGTLSSDEACLAEPRAFNNKAIKRGEGTLETIIIKKIFVITSRRFFPIFYFITSCFFFKLNKI